MRSCPGAMQMRSTRWLLSAAAALLLGCANGGVHVTAPGTDAHLDAPAHGGEAGSTGLPTGTGGGAGAGGAGGTSGSGGLAGSGGIGGAGGTFAAGCSSFDLYSYNAPDVSSCGPSYAHFSIAVKSASPRGSIAECGMSITDETGSTILSDEDLEKWYGVDSVGNILLKEGCSAGMTPALVGTYYYLTSRLTGGLRFEVMAYDDHGAIIQSGASSLIPIAPYPPEIPVTINMVSPSDGGVSGASGGRDGAGGSVATD
jgi:hypothetical protein